MGSVSQCFVQIVGPDEKEDRRIASVAPHKEEAIPLIYSDRPYSASPKFLKA
ncbi:MAG: hypothetical protein Q8L37_05375 [Candidatus Gottesmanbacteria bacterium]|nr:hypothetical protein [Candidatus Gottesmanbacteria bacterium]